MEIKIGSTILTSQSEPYFIADIAANHDGDIQRAYHLIELAKECGANAAKFQNFQADTIISHKAFDNLGHQIAHQSSWEKSVYQVYKEASIKNEWIPLLKQKCNQVGIEYMSTPYNLEVIDHLDPYVNSYKIGSGDITWDEMLIKTAKKGKPILLATGASDFTDVERAISIIKKYNNQIVLMQCNTNYTANYNNFSYINLNVLRTYDHVFPECLLGLSDHTLGHTTVLGAIAMGAVVIEKHFTDDNSRTGPDHKFSMNPTTWKEMINESKKLYLALGDGIKKIEKNETESAIIQRRSLYLKCNVVAGDILKKEDLIPLRPISSSGIEPWDWEKVCGKRLLKNKKEGCCICLKDVENI